MNIRPDDPMGGGETSREELLKMLVQRAQASPQQRPYGNHSAREQAIQDPEQRQMAQHKYAGNRLGQFQKIAALLGGDFQQAVQGQDMSDPLAAFKALSGKFAETSKARGVADPRQLLMQLLMQLGGGRR